MQSENASVGSNNTQNVYTNTDGTEKSEIATGVSDSHDMFIFHLREARRYATKEQAELIDRYLFTL